VRKKKSQNEPVWMVYCENFNTGLIEPVNIFGKESRERIKKLKRRANDYEDFCALLRSEIRWQFWCRCEYEVVIAVTYDGRILLKPWVNPKHKDNYTVD